MTHFDASLLVFLCAAALAHRKVSQEKPEHVGVYHALVGVTVADMGTLALYPNRGLLPLMFSLATPGACLYGVCATHGFRKRLTIVTVLTFVLASWLCSLVDPLTYPWAVLMSWSMLAGISWVCLLDPERTPTGITRFASVALAASLMADLPGIYVWARYGTWRAESVITSLSVTILATMPMLWKLWTCRQSSSGQSCSVSDSYSDEEAEARPLKPCD
jgi:hypothetical protein